MSSNSTNESPCRICLKTNVFFDWTEAIFEFSGPSYKECYYQYTHLQEREEDVYTQMLCLECGNGLRNTYQLVEKALESIKMLNEMQTADDPLEYEKECNIKYSVNPNTKDALNANTEIQELDKSLEELVILDIQLDDEVLNNDFTATQDSDTKDALNANTEIQELDKSLEELVILDIQLDDEVLNNDFTATQDSDSKYESDGSNSSMSNNHSKLQTDNVEVKRQPLLCAYCSRIFYKFANLINHEKTHDGNRERTETCPICGLKFFDKTALKSHIPVHDENRIREFKCEFCVKAFFSRGGLTIHRRKHLGQMLKCKFCSKEYCRQFDLDRHMPSHDISPITMNTEKVRRVQATFFMECNTCGRKISRKYWEAHKARHLNQPLLQCGICNKTYYCRKSICLHIKKCHEGEEYDKAIITMNKKFKPRHTSLMKKQNIEIE